MYRSTERTLARIVGPSAYSQLCVELGGQRLRIPKTRTLIAERRRAAVAHHLAEGMACGEIARRLNISARRVRQIAAMPASAAVEDDHVA